MNEARAERRRAVVLGRAKIGGIPPYWFLWGALVIGGFGVIYWRKAQGELESAKGEVMAEQRAVAHALGPRIIPFRDRIESWVKELADPYEGDFIAPDASLTEITRSPGVYLRLSLKEAQKIESIRDAAAESLRDGFTACLFVDQRTKDPTKGAECTTTKDCEAGMLCNEFAVCTPPPRPYNMRLAYRALRVLSTEWTDELHEASSDLAVVAYQRDLEAVTHHDVPLAIEVLTRAEYFTAVLDEKPESGLPEEIADAGETDAERVQRVEHFARIGIWNIEKKKQVLRLRTKASGRFVPVGARHATDPSAKAAQQRQANNCSLALQVKAKLQQAAAKDALGAGAEEEPASENDAPGEAKP